MGVWRGSNFVPRQYFSPWCISQPCLSIHTSACIVLLDRINKKCSLPKESKWPLGKPIVLCTHRLDTSRHRLLLCNAMFLLTLAFSIVVVGCMCSSVNGNSRGCGGLWVWAIAKQLKKKTKASSSQTNGVRRSDKNNEICKEGRGGGAECFVWEDLYEPNCVRRTHGFTKGDRVDQDG